MAIGIFSNHGDIGQPEIAGDAIYDPTTDSYNVVGAGKNMWLANDEFHFSWKVMEGDFSLEAEIDFPQIGLDPHRKACLLVRQSLDSSSAYVDAAFHGDGLTSLQFRYESGDRTSEVQSNGSYSRLRLVRHGHYVSLYTGDADGLWHFSGCSTRVCFSGPVLAGIGVCSHDASIAETARFSSVKLSTLDVNAARDTLYSVLETQSVSSTDRRVCLVTDKHIEAPNWTADGSTIVVNGSGRLFQVPAAGGELEVIDTDFAIKCNNDHGISPDGTQIVISDQSQAGGQSLIYILPIGGGTPEIVTTEGPSYWHGWSPDGTTLTFCGQRDGTFGIFTVPAAGGQETRLTTAEGLDDGPEYSPDGQYIYFNSDRTGRMQIWRMHTNGTGQQQVTNDEYANWFAHPSPDGKWITVLSYASDVSGHPPNKDVSIRLMSVDENAQSYGPLTVIARIFGGQGTINVPCWSPDSSHIAFVSYHFAAA